mmetsp:Transcript_1415/g.2012  ORF Transcript_1415/g.2012 Transcript_1415/m.2012 type:complete len:248 (+) Transcript_1415:2731-3474(+)
MQGMRHRVLDQDGLSLLISRHHVPRVGGDGKGEKFNALALGEELEDGLAHGVVELHGAVLSQALQLVGDVHIAEALYQSVLIRLQVHTRHRGNGGGNLGKVRANEIQDTRVRHCLVDVPMAQQICHARERRMSAVEHSDLHKLIHGYILHHQCARHLPLRSAPVHKPVFNHPLHEVLSHYRPGILNPVLLSQLLNITLISDWSDAIHHCHGEGNVGSNPLTQIRINAIGQLHDQSLALWAVFRDIVA